jgi:MFS-type transporter involved in bile tolerance (Atg22 family)
VVPEKDENAAMKGIKQLIITVIAVMICAGGATVFACPVCFGAEETTLISGTKLGILVMIGITFAVQGAFLAFFLYLRKRAKQSADVELEAEWSELQRSRT